MAECKACVREAEGLTKYESPAVGGQEWVCRNARKPEDWGKPKRPDHVTNGLRDAFIRTREFRDGQLSAWRVSDPSELPILAEKLRAKGWRADMLLAAKAETIRAIRTERPGRAICVINDTRTDTEGNHDRQHVALSPCTHLLQAPEDLEVEMTDLKAQLKLVFMSSKVAFESPQGSRRPD